MGRCPSAGRSGGCGRMPLPAHGENERRDRDRRRRTPAAAPGRPARAGGGRGRRGLRPALGSRPPVVRGLGGRARPPALLRPPAPARPRLEQRPGRGARLAGVARHAHAAPAPVRPRGRARGRALLPAPRTGWRRTSTTGARARGSSRSSCCRARPASATAGQEEPAVSTCASCARPGARWRWSGRARRTSPRRRAPSWSRSRRLREAG